MLRIIDHSKPHVGAAEVAEETGWEGMAELPQELLDNILRLMQVGFRLCRLPSLRLTRMIQWLL